MTNKYSKLHKKWSFLLRISAVNVTKSAGNCGLGHIYWKILNGKLHFVCNGSSYSSVSFCPCAKKKKKKKSQKATDNPKFCWNLIQLKYYMKNFITSVRGIANLWLHTFSFRLICGCPFENGGMFNVTLANKSYSKSNPLSAIILSLSSNNEIRPLCFAIYLLNFLSSSIKVKNKKWVLLSDISGIVVISSIVVLIVLKIFWLGSIRRRHVSKDLSTINYTRIWI